MMLDFVKMNGAGNDFILIDNRSGKIKLTTEQVVRLCHRQRGIGADGLFLLVPNTSGKAEWSWEFYNSDGSTADMCGNGARCFARFVQSVAGAKEQTSFETGAGVISATFHGARVSVNLTTPKDLRLGEIVPAAGAKLMVHSLNTGVPHAVIFVPDADKAMVQQLGARRFATTNTSSPWVRTSTSRRCSARTTFASAPTNAEWKARRSPVARA